MKVRDQRRSFIYHSPQYPGFTCWCGCWNMPDGSVMVSFTQATGPISGRPHGTPEALKRLNWPPVGHTDTYDMTGLDMENVHLRSTDFGRTWERVSSDHFTTCMNGTTGEAEEALPDGTILRGVWGPYLPYDDVPYDGYMQRSTDGGLTWSGPELINTNPGYIFWPKRVRVLRDGRVITGGGYLRLDPDYNTRSGWFRDCIQALFVSDDSGRSWQGPISLVSDAQKNEFTGEEFDFVELDNGDLLAVIRAETMPTFDTRDPGQDRRQTRLVKTGDTWQPTVVTMAPFAHSGHPEMLKVKEGAVLHIATPAISYTTDEGKTWADLELEPSTVGQQFNWPAAHSYPRSVQMQNGEILIVGHDGNDDGYGTVDQCIVGLSFFVEE